MQFLVYLFSSASLCRYFRVNKAVLKSIYIYNNNNVGLKELVTLAHFISKSWSMPRKKKCSRMNKESPDRQDVLPRTTLSPADQDHEKGRCHTTKGSLLEGPNGRPKRRGSAIGAWRRSNPKKGLHLHIKYP